jgi:hypothetical protein
MFYNGLWRFGVVIGDEYECLLRLNGRFTALIVDGLMAATDQVIEVSLLVEELVRCCLSQTN